MRIEDATNFSDGEPESAKPEEVFYIENEIEWSNALQSRDMDEDSDGEQKKKQLPIIPGQGINEFCRSTL
jgi:hypothetical protein